METRIRPVTPIPIGKLLSAQLPPTTSINDKKRRAEVFAECCRFVCPGFKVEGAFRKIMNDIFLYAEGDSGAGKGLLLTGDYGTGKSTIMQILNKYLWFIGGRDAGDYPIGGFRIDSASYVSTGFSMKGRDYLELYTYNGGIPRTICFDELGREPIPSKHFGTELNVMQYILQCRYELRYECKTHITTNLSIEEIQDRYGAYIADRINEMFNVIELKGSSRR